MFFAWVYLQFSHGTPNISIWYFCFWFGSHSCCQLLLVTRYIISKVKVAVVVRVDVG